MKTVLTISFSNLATDPRVNRQIRFLKEKYRVIAAGLADPQVENVRFIPLLPITRVFRNVISPLELLFRRFEKWYWSQRHVIDCLERLSGICPDLILANDIDTLPLALKLSKGRKVIFDAHEYAPREFEDSLFWRIFFQRYKTFLCRVYIPRVSGMTTVCQGIADTYKKETGIEPMVVTNAPDFEDIGPNLLLEEGRNIRLVYHGGAMPSRKIENMIRMMDFLDGRFELNLILTVSDHHYNERLKRLAERKPNIHFLPPVPMRILPKYLNQYDIGVYILEPTNFNNLYALPNKFFEFIQARLAIAVSPSPEMARIVQSHELGVVAQDYTPEALAHRLLALDRQKIDYYKLRSHTVARILSAEQNKKILLSLISRVLEE